MKDDRARLRAAAGASPTGSGQEDLLTVQDFVDIGVSKRTAQGYLCGTAQGFRPVPAFLLWTVARTRLEAGREAPLVRWLVQLQDLARSAGRLIG